MPLYPPAPTGGGTSYTFGTAAPSGGNPGDVYERTSAPFLLYQNQAGTWVPVGLSSALFEKNPAMRSAPWTITSQGANTNTAAASVAQLLNVSQTGVTASGGNFVASNATAYGRFYGARGALGYVTVVTLPTAAQVLKFGVGISFSGNTCFPFIEVNSSGVATLTVGGTVIKTFSRTVVANDVFTVRVFGGSVLVCVQDGSTFAIVDQVLYAAGEVTQGNVDAYGMGFYLRGYGTVNVSPFEVYA